MEAISKVIAVAPSDPNLPGTGCIQRGYQLLESKFDVDYGGFGSAPKFPQPGGYSNVSTIYIHQSLHPSLLLLAILIVLKYFQ